MSELGGDIRFDIVSICKNNQTNVGLRLFLGTLYAINIVFCFRHCQPFIINVTYHDIRPHFHNKTIIQDAQYSLDITLCGECHLMCTVLKLIYPYFSLSWQFSNLPHSQDCRGISQSNTYLLISFNWRCMVHTFSLYRNSGVLYFIHHSSLTFCCSKSIPLYVSLISLICTDDCYLSPVTSIGYV